MEEKGLLFTGVDDRNQRMEIIELRESDHPFYLGVQYHPEFKTVVGKPSPPFYGFVLAASGQFEGVGKPLKSTEQFRNLLQSPHAADSAAGAAALAVLVPGVGLARGVVGFDVAGSETYALALPAIREALEACQRCAPLVW